MAIPPPPPPLVRPPEKLIPPPDGATGAERGALKDAAGRDTGIDIGRETGADIGRETGIEAGAAMVTGLGALTDIGRGAAAVLGTVFTLTGRIPENAGAGAVETVAGCLNIGVAEEVVMEAVEVGRGPAPIWVVGAFETGNVVAVGGRTAVLTTEVLGDMAPTVVGWVPGARGVATGGGVCGVVRPGLMTVFGVKGVVVVGRVVVRVLGVKGVVEAGPVASVLGAGRVMVAPRGVMTEFGVIGVTTLPFGEMTVFGVIRVTLPSRVITEFG